MIRTYKIIDIKEIPSPGKSRFLTDVTAIHIADGKEALLENISLPVHARKGDLIRWAEHRFYDVIDQDGNFVYRNL